MDVIPLDATLVKGSHGRRPADKKDWPVLITSQPEGLGANADGINGCFQSPFAAFGSGITARLIGRLETIIGGPVIFLLHVWTRRFNL